MGHLRTARRIVVAAVVFVFATAAFGATVVPVAGAAQGSGGGAALLGQKDPATGTPIKIGVVSNGKNATGDASIESPVAEATTKWVNEYLHGVGGHPIELDICIDEADAGKANDCANQLIGDHVAAVVMGSNGVLENVWKPLHDAGVPVMMYAASGSPTKDAQSSFVLNNSQASLFALPAGVAKERHAKKVSIVAIDVPAATDFYRSTADALFKQEGLTMNLVPVAGGTADMTPQMAELVRENPNGVVYLLGPDSFCIAALNGLRTAGFKGQVTATSFCMSDATRTAVPGSMLKGMKISATAPLDDPKNPATKQYNAVLDKYGASVDRTSQVGIAMFSALSGLALAAKDVTGQPTPVSMTAAIKAMPEQILPGSGGLSFRCNGKAAADSPGFCSHGSLVATLDAKGKAKTYSIVGNDPIPN